MKNITLTVAICAATLLAACGKQEAAAPAAAPAGTSAPEAAAAAPAAAENEVGKSVFNKTCAVCHAAGVAGAPKPGDKADWGPRIAQGMDVLNKHAIEGFTGAKGQMPPKGGSTASDDEVKAAVKYMTDASR